MPSEGLEYGRLHEGRYPLFAGRSVPCYSRVVSPRNVRAAVLALNYYKRHLGDYSRDAGHLSLLEHGVYTRLLDLYYIRETPIPEESAARLVGARSATEKDAVQSVLHEFFSNEGGFWRHKRCDQEIAAYQMKAARNREIGQTGGRPKKNETQTEPRNNPDGFQTEPTANPSHKPLANNQEEEGADAPVPGLDTAAWERWLNYRRKLGKPLKPVSHRSAQKQMAALGPRQMAAVEHTEGNGWTGLREPDQRGNQSSDGKLRVVV